MVMETLDAFRQRTNYQIVRCIQKLTQQFDQIFYDYINFIGVLQHKQNFLSNMKTSTTPVVAAAAGIMIKSSNRGRGVPQISNEYANKCSCQRDKTMVFCRACGFYCHGRVRLKCEQHPRLTFLLDITECPRCHSSVFLDEICTKK